jgi:hypothetical protein
VVTVAWGVLTFGAVYPWAYVPLLVAASVLGVWGMSGQVALPGRRVKVALAAGLVLLVLGVVLQVVSLPAGWIATISPATDRVLRAIDAAYALAVFSQQPVSHPVSVDVGGTALGLTFVVGFGLFLLGLTRSLDGVKLRALCPQLVALGSLVALIGIVQRPFFTGKIYGFWTPQAGELLFSAGGGPFGPFVNRNHFAGWMLMMVPLSIGHFCALASRGMRGVKPGWRARVVWFSSPQANQVLLFGFAPLLMASSVVLTLSRSGTLCLLVALAVCAAAAALRRQAGVLRRVIVLAVPLLIAIVGLSWAGTDAIDARFDDMTTDLDGRLPAWQDAWRVIQDAPWTGTGLNTYGTTMLVYQTFRVDAMHFAEAHSDYLQILAEGGVLLAVPALVLAGIVAREIWRRFRQGGDDDHGFWLRVGAVSGLIAILLQEAVEFSLQMPGNAALFVILCAIATRDPSAKPATAERGEAGP